MELNHGGDPIAAESGIKGLLIEIRHNPHPLHIGMVVLEVHEQLSPFGLSNEAR
tara:strand:- start:511 stop:672 length:162 start_codon:yes stop_codon:yes gene_type:complete